MLLRFTIFFIFGIPLYSHAQNFEWVKSYGGSGAENKPLCYTSSNSSIIAWTASGPTKFGSFNNPKKNLKLAVGKVDQSGSPLWLWTTDSISGNAGIGSLFYDTLNSKIYVTGYLQGKIYIGGNSWSSFYSKSINKYSTNGLLIKLNAKGQFEDILVLKDSNNCNINSIVEMKKELIISVDFIVKTTTKFCAINTSCFDKSGIVICSLDSNFKIKKITKIIEGTIGGAKVDLNKKMLLTFFSRSPVSYTDSLINYYDKIDGYYAVFLDSNLKIKKIGKLYSYGYSFVSSSLTENGEIVAGTSFQDSIYFKNKVIYFGKITSPVVLIFDSNNYLKYASYPKIITSLNGGHFYTLKYHNGFIYAGGNIGGNYTFGDIKTYQSQGWNLITKLDLKGNFLWAKRFSTSNSLQYINSISAFNKEIFAVGIYRDTSYLNGQQFISNGSIDILAMKIRDIEIYRGYVKSGPYCAGDTIKIPYTKDGDFNSGNQFIAQLSDEEGNFTGKKRELGRLTSTNAGTIKGVLPMFDVESSHNYRIRIISTNPVVQSYYKSDTLRLLIYSRDKANPGSAETICYGDSIRLMTYGGTKWTWSPKYNMNDSTFKKPWVWPTKTTTYKIIIADSSGCGKPDTAFKKILVRNPLKLNVASDITVCDTSILKIAADFAGGDSTNYICQWYLRSSKNFKLLRIVKSKLEDTLSYIPKVSLTKNDSLMVVLSDHCTNKNDTAFIIIRLAKPSFIPIKFTDMQYCKGNTVRLKTKAQYGKPTDYVWQWKDRNSNRVLSIGDTLNLITDTTLEIKLTISNGCTKDSNTFMINVYPPLEAIIQTGKGLLKDTAVCFGQSLPVFTTGKGGAGVGYIYSWLLNGKLISTADQVMIKPDSTSTLALILKDNCTNKADTMLKTIGVMPTPVADFSWDLACSLTKTQFQYTGTKPIKTFNWNFNNKASSTLENPSYQFAAGSATLTLALTSSNGCTDTIRKTILVKIQSKADFTAQDVCENTTVVFKNLSNNATNYNWKFGDGKNSNLSSPNHNYNIAGITKTFNVTLVAIVLSGCSDSVSKAVTVNANPKSDFSYTTSSKLVNFTASETNATQYQWMFGDGGTANITTQKTAYTYSKFPSGKYTACLKVTNTANCLSETCKEIFISGSVGALTEKSGFKIYPNPNSGSFEVYIENPDKDLTISVYNSIGELIKTTPGQSSQKIYSIEMNVANGIYLVKIMNGGRVYNERVVVNK